MLDTSRAQYYFISNEVHDILQKKNFKSIEKESIEEGFFDLLVDNDLVYETDDRIDNCFVPIELEWDFSFKITNLVLELSNKNIEHLQKFAKFDYVAHFHILLKDNIKPSTIDKLFDFLEIQPCDSIEFSFIFNFGINLLKQFKNRFQN